MKKKSYKIKEKVWLYPGDMAAWHFITLPKSAGMEIKETYGALAKGFGSLPVEVTIGKTKWRTSIFPDKISKSYLLPLKAKVRTSEEIEVGDVVTCTLTLL